MYTNVYEIQEQKNGVALPLCWIMHQGKSQGQGDWTEKDERSKIQIQLAMFNLANYFDISELRDSTACSLVEDVTCVDSAIWTRDTRGTFSFEKNADYLPIVFETIWPLFAESTAMKRLETRIAEFLAAAKIVLFAHKDRQILPFIFRLGIAPQDEFALSGIFNETKACINGSPSFGKTCAKAMNEVVGKASRRQEWYMPKLESFMLTSSKSSQSNDRS